MATDLAALGKHELALEIDRDTLARRKRVLGDENPATKATAHNLTLDMTEVTDNASGGTDPTKRRSTPLDYGATMFW